MPLAQLDHYAKPDSEEKKADVYYFHTDHLGTPRELTDSRGEICWSASYKTWGNVLVEEWYQDQDEREAYGRSQALRFQGQYFDVETGLHYNRFRYYDPDIGRFVSQDPIGLAGGENLYQYAPNPVEWIDPLGLSPEDLVRYKPRDTLSTQLGNRETAISRAWALERKLVMETGSGTRDWSAAEKELIMKTKNSGVLTSKMSNLGYTGHHINSVKNGELGEKWQADPRNIVFLQNAEHPSGYDEHISSNQGHRGNYQNMGSGRLIDRQAMIDQHRVNKTKGCK